MQNSAHSAPLRLIESLRRRPLAWGAGAVLLVFIGLAMFGQTLAPYPYDELVRDAGGTVLRRQPPSAEFLFGTDRLGRDVFSRVLWGAREVVWIPAIATLLAVGLGASLGLWIGYRGGWLDEIVSRLLDSFLAIPALVLALALLTSIGSSSAGIIAVIVAVYTPIVARVTRSATLAVRSAGYIEAARLRGESLGYILFREILPSVLPVLIVEGALRFSYAIFLTASLGYLGLGVQPPSPDWGRMVNEARGDLTSTPWALWSPALAIALLVISVNIVADELKRVFRYEGNSR